MWIASKIGFFSIVWKDGYFHVRARVQGDLETLRRLACLDAEIECWPEADYRWRIRVTQADLATVFRTLQWTVDYPNFKGEIHASKSQVAKLPTYHDLWAGLHRLQLAEERDLQAGFTPLAGARNCSQTFANMPSQAAKVPKSAASLKKPRK